MPASWPVSVKTFTTKVDITDTNYAAHVNDLQNEITALETYLGLNPHISTARATTYGSVLLRLEALETDYSLDTHTHTTSDVSDLALSDYVADALFTAKGTIAVATAASTPAALPVGVTDGLVLEVASAQATGMQWGSAPIKKSVGTTKGDLVSFSAAATPERIGTGGSTNEGFALTVAASQTVGMKWNRNDQIEVFAREGAATITTGVHRFMLPYAWVLLGVTLTVGTAPTGQSLIVDINRSGTTVFTTQANRPTIIAEAFSTAAEVTNMNTTAFSSSQYLTVDIDQVGSTIAGSNLSVIIRWRWDTA